MFAFCMKGMGLPFLASIHPGISSLGMPRGLGGPTVSGNVTEPNPSSEHLPQTPSPPSPPPALPCPGPVQSVPDYAPFSATCLSVWSKQNVLPGRRKSPPRPPVLCSQWPRDPVIFQPALSPSQPLRSASLNPSPAGTPPGKPPFISIYLS